MTKQTDEKAVVERKEPPPVPTSYFTRGAVDGLNEQLKKLRDGGYNVLGPTTFMPVVPEGFGIVLNVLKVDPTPPDRYGKGGGGDVYLVDAYRDKDGYALTKVMLDKIAGAFGVTWLPGSSKRLDDRREPLYCHYRAVGRVRDFDGTVRTVIGEKEIDLRPGSALHRMWRKQSEAAVKRDEKNAGATPERIAQLTDEKLQARLDQVQEHILSLAESKAKNRAVRGALGIRQKYTAADLKRPIVVPKLVPAPESILDDDTRKQVMVERMRDAMGLTDMLYGGEAPADAPALVDASPGATETPHAPPPVKVEPDADDPDEQDDTPPPDGSDPF